MQLKLHIQDQVNIVNFSHTYHHQRDTKSDTTEKRKNRPWKTWPHLMFSDILYAKKIILNFQVYQNNHSGFVGSLGSTEQIGEISEGRERIQHLPTLKKGKRRKQTHRPSFFKFHSQ